MSKADFDVAIREPALPAGGPAAERLAVPPPTPSPSRLWNRSRGIGGTVDPALASGRRAAEQFLMIAGPNRAV